MRWLSCAATAALACLFFTDAAQSAEIKVISSDGFALVLDAIKPKYEQATGNTLVIHYDIADNLKTDILGGETFDVVVSTAEVMRDIIPDNKIVTATRVDIARAGIGLAYKAGTPKPDIHDAASFKNTLLQASSIANLDAGASGGQFNSLVQKFGIRDQVRAKLTPLPPTESRSASSATGAAGQNSILQAVLDGRATFGVQIISNILLVPGVEYVAFPPDMQLYRAYSAAVGAASKQPDAAATFMKYLTDPQLVPLIKSKGMEPG